MSIIVHGGTIDATKIAVPRSQGGWSLEALARYIPPTLVAKVLKRTGRSGQRHRRLPAPAVVWLVIAIGLWGDRDIPAIWRQVEGTLRNLLRAAGLGKPPGKSALSKARSRLGARPLRQLFLAVSRPLAQRTTRGAFYHGLRLMIIDGQKLLLPDTVANRKAFGKQTTRRFGRVVSAGYPQVHLIRLLEAGTHLTVELLVKPFKKHEYPLAGALLNKARPNDLILWDRGFYGYGLLRQAIDTGRYVLGRVSNAVVFDVVQTLADGSFLARVYPSRQARRRRENGLLVRVIAYSFRDPNRPGHGQRHRLVTTLLNAQEYPAQELVVLYHQRWEIEIDNDEITTHQLNRPVELRSGKPVNIVQEIYGIYLAHNAIRALMHEAALRVDIDPRTLSFINAVRVIRDAIPLLRAARRNQLPKLYHGLLAQIGRGTLPPRDGRINPRVVKIKMSNYKKKGPEHLSPPQPCIPFDIDVFILK
jgi:hypothetical protein